MRSGPRVYSADIDANRVVRPRFIACKEHAPTMSDFMQSLCTQKYGIRALCNMNQSNHDQKSGLDTPHYYLQLAVATTAAMNKR